MRLARIFECIYLARSVGQRCQYETIRQRGPVCQAAFAWRFGNHSNRTVHQRKAGIRTAAFEREDSAEIRSTGDRPRPSANGQDPQAMALLGIRALRLGSRTGKFSDERPVPKFKEKMNAGTISEWLSHNDHT